MEDDNNPSAGNLAENLANLSKAVAPFLPKFRNLRKVRDRLLGDVSEAAFDALVSRLRLYQTRRQAEAITIAVERTGLPPAHVHEAFSRQESLDKIVASALLQVAQGTASMADPEVSDSLSADDWFDVYRSEAAARGAGDMREAFVRILAGEIQRPGSFSVHTLRVLGIINTATAKKFLRAASVCIASDLKSDARIPAVGGKLGQNALSHVGLSYDVLTQLTENGLLHPDYNCYMPYGPVGIPHVKPPIPPILQVPFRHQGKEWVLEPSTDKFEGKELRVEGAAFTTAARELLTVVDMEQMPEFTERLKAHFSRLKYEMVEASGVKVYR